MWSLTGKPNTDLHVLCLVVAGRRFMYVSVALVHLVLQDQSGQLINITFKTVFTCKFWRIVPLINVFPVGKNLNNSTLRFFC